MKHGRLIRRPKTYGLGLNIFRFNYETRSIVLSAPTSIASVDGLEHGTCGTASRKRWRSRKSAGNGQRLLL